MFCRNCGAKNSKNSEFCTSCGSKLSSKNNSKLVGFSEKINDPFYSKYVKNTSSYRKVFGIGLSIILTLAFFIYGEFSDQMDNPQAVFIGLGIAIVYNFIIFKITKPSKDPSWEGQVVDKNINRKRQRVREDTGEYSYRDHIEYTVVFEGRHGQKHEVTTENNDSVYEYYQVGDKVKFHGFLKTIEKYDKSEDEIIFCVACGDINDVNNDYCQRCNAPLLK